jgi:hypothetical protein
MSSSAQEVDGSMSVLRLATVEMAEHPGVAETLRFVKRETKLWVTQDFLTQVLSKSNWSGDGR